MRYQQFLLYIFVLLLVTFLFISAVGGGLFNQDDHWLIQWQHKMFSVICHQEPIRSFWIGDQPMAVCSRCLGMYSSFWMGWLLLPGISYFNYTSFGHVKNILVVLIIFNLIDVVGNLLGFWQNTLYSRLILGILTGGAATHLFSDTFFIYKIKPKGDHYARTTTTEAGK